MWMGGWVMVVHVVQLPLMATDTSPLVTVFLFLPGSLQFPTTFDPECVPCPSGPTIRGRVTTCTAYERSPSARGPSLIAATRLFHGVPGATPV